MLAVLALLLTPASATSQPPPGTTENPEGAVRLRTIWVKTGTGAVLDSTVVGTNAMGLGDVNSDGYDDVSVRVGHRHHVYLGGNPMSLDPVQILDSAGYPSGNYPVVGDFLGTGERLYGYFMPRPDPNHGAVFIRMTFFRWDIDSMMVPTDLKLNLREQPASEKFMASDLDGDGDDELIFVNREGRDAVVRIYEGGERFSLETPTSVMRVVDSTAISGSALTISSTIADFDGDQRPDLYIGKFNSDVSSGEQEVWFWWGSDSGFRGWGNIPDRIVASLPLDIAPFPIYASFSEDLDGDGIAEIFARIRVEPDFGAYVWLTRGRESARTRDFNEETYDHYYPATRTRGFGYVADSLERYEMMALRGERDAYGFGGGLYGPNDTYGAHFGGGDGPAFGGVDAGDVDGNGWRDRLIASETYGGPGVGRAVIVAGGPYIPVDDPTVSVRSEPVAGEPGGLKLWPNTVRDRVTIAWRGDLERMPHRVILVDASGRMLLDRGLPTWKGTTALDLTGYPVSSYRLVLYDIDGAMIAVTSLVIMP